MNRAEVYVEYSKCAMASSNSSVVVPVGNFNNDKDKPFLNSIICISSAIITKLWKLITQPSPLELYFLLWLFWLLLGTLFYHHWLGITHAKAFYMSVNVGYSIGWGDIDENDPYPGCNPRVRRRDSYELGQWQSALQPRVGLLETRTEE